MPEPTLVSACLLGVRCRYDGQSKRAPLPAGPLLPVCPEVMAGFGVPRPAIEHDPHGQVRVLATREDVTARLQEACDRVVHLAEARGVRAAVLKERSPSCGSRNIYVSGRLVAGVGLLTAALRSRGITVRSEEALS